MKNLVIAGLRSAMLSPLSRALELSRGLQSYIIAADLIGYQDAEFKARVRELVYANIQGHSGTGLFGTATNCSNNWGGHARASLAAAALYLNDSVMLAAVRQGHLEFIGEWTGTRKFVYTNTGWHFDPNNKAGVNRADAGIFSGILPEDWRRDTSIDPANISSYNDMMSLNTVYSWEGMQGFVVAAAILHHAGIVPFSAGNGAVARAMDVLYKTNQPADGDDTWIPHLVNFYAGTTFPLPSSIQAGKGMGYTNWTHAR